MKQMQILTQEPYEAPAILDIMPVTMVSGQEASGGQGGEDYPDPTDPSGPGGAGDED